MRYITVHLYRIRHKQIKTTSIIMKPNFYQFSATSLQGKEIDMKSYEGKIVLVVNTASKCGLTPQYEGLEKLHKEYKDKGLVILGFPCNQFANQEPGDEKSISEKMIEKLSSELNGYNYNKNLTALNNELDTIKNEYNRILLKINKTNMHKLINEYYLPILDIYSKDKPNFLLPFFDFKNNISHYLM